MITFECQRLYRGTPSEHCDVVVDKNRSTVTVSSSSVVTSFALDDVEGCMWSNDRSVFVFLLAGTSSDVVLQLATLLGVASIAAEVWEARGIRVQRGKSVKIIRYVVEGDVLDAVVNGSGPLKWDQGVERTEVIEFPHTRLDFLKLHANRSVMYKLSSNDEFRIELSCDSVTAVSTEFSVPDGEPRQRTAGWPRDADGLRQLAEERGTPNCVVILSEKALSVTEATGFVLVRIEMDDVCDVKVAGGAISLDYSLRSKEGQRESLALLSKYSADIAQRIRSSLSQQRSGALEVAPAKKVIAAPSKSPERKAVSVATATQTEEELRVASPSKSGEELCVTPEDEAIITTLRMHNGELKTMVEHKELTIQVLQQRCEELAFADPRASRSTTPRSQTPTTPRGGSRKAQKEGSRTAASSTSDVNIRVYVQLLEALLAKERRLDVKKRLDFLEGNMADKREQLGPQALLYALRESERHRDELLEENHRLKDEMKRSSAASQRVLSEMGAKVNVAIQDFILSYKASDAGVQLCDQVSNAIDESEKRIEHEVKIRTRDIMAANAELVDELRLRDQQLDLLSKQMVTAEGGHASSSGVSPAAAAQLKDRQVQLENHVAVLMRRIDDLKAVENNLRASVLDQVASDSSTAEVLRSQNQVLQKLNGARLAEARLASLEGIAEQYEQKITAALQANQRLEEMVKSGETTKKQQDTLQIQIRSLKEKVHSLETKASDLEEERNQMRDQLHQSHATMKNEARDHRKQEKYLRERIQELTQALRKRDDYEPMLSARGGLANQSVASIAPAESERSAVRPSNKGAVVSPVPLPPHSTTQVDVSDTIVVSPNHAKRSLEAAMEFIHHHSGADAGDAAHEEADRSVVSVGGATVQPAPSVISVQDAWESETGASTVRAESMGVIDTTSPDDPVAEELRKLRKQTSRVAMEREQSYAADQIARLQAELVLARHAPQGSTRRPKSPGATMRAAASASRSHSRQRSPSASRGRSTSESRMGHGGPATSFGDPAAMVAKARQRYAMMKDRLKP